MSLARLREFAAVQFRRIQDGVYDLKFGGSTGTYVSTRFAHLGAYDSGTASYFILLNVFNGKIRPDDVIVDVGCGFGRAINTLLWMNCKNRIVGLELDPEIAESSRKRLRRFDNVEIVTGNALDHLPADGTVFWIFNSFDEAVVR